MEQFQNAQMKLNELTIVCMTANKVMSEMMSDDNTLKQYGEQLGELSKLIEFAANAIGEFAGLIAAGSPSVVKQMMEEGRF